MRPLIAITMGDPAGIGPEITVRALARPEVHQAALPLVIGDAGCLEAAISLLGSPLRVRAIGSPAQAREEPGLIQLIDLGLMPSSSHRWGRVSKEAGEAAFQYVLTGIGYAMRREIGGVATGPISKEALHLAGHPYAGHTEIFAEFTGTRDFAMMLASGRLRVIHVTTHVSMRQAADLIKKERVLRTILLARQALEEIGIRDGRIAVAGFNCHASENGLFGNEEKEQIIPAIQAARKRGVRVEGPFPPDSVFIKALAGQYDIVVAMYHDQGHIPLKLSGFRIDPVTGRFTSMSGINTTIGLPIVRTSVDHGTAFDIAGRGIANEESMVEAILLAARMALARNPT